MKYTLLILLTLLISCNPDTDFSRKRIDLHGQWQFTLDTANIGQTEKWYMYDLPDDIQLPGTTDSNKKGFRNTDTTTLHLNRPYSYEGKAWYRKEVSIPKSYQNKHIQLEIERTKSTSLWIDSTFIGSSGLLQSAQVYDLSQNLTPGNHYITLLVDTEASKTI